MPREHATPLEGLAALFGHADWSQEKWLAARAQQEQQQQAGAEMPNRFGRLTPQQAAAMAKSFRETMPPHQAAEWTKALELLTDRPASPVRASATVDDGTGVADEFASLWPPRTKAEDEQRAEQRRLRVAASASVDDDDLYSAIFGESPR